MDGRDLGTYNVRFKDEEDGKEYQLWDLLSLRKLHEL
jgi:hypothetical protein